MTRPRPTLRDVATGAGVHPATASRALNPTTRGLVNAATASRVIEVAQALGYQPNPIARSLKTSRSGTVGLVIPDLTNPLFPPMARGMEDVLTAAGYSAWIVNTDNDDDRERAQVVSLRARQVEGLVIATARAEQPLLEELLADGFPMVLLNRRRLTEDIPAVVPDDAGGMALAVEHLVGLGHRRIGHLAGPQDTSTGQVRYESYQRALRTHGLPDDPALVGWCDTWTEVAGAAALAELLDADVGFTAVVAGNDLLALGCYDALEERGLRCPDDISIVGFNDTPFMDKLRPPLTTVHVPHYEAGAEAARLLLEILGTANPPGPERPADGDPAAVTTILLPLSLTIRQSTAAPAAAA